MQTRELKPIGKVEMDNKGRVFIISSGRKLSMYEAERLKAKIEHRPVEVKIYTTED